MTTKFTLTLPDRVASDLERWAVEEGRNKTNLGNYLVEAAVRHKYPEEYPPPDAYAYGLKGIKKISNSGSENSAAVHLIELIAKGDSLPTRTIVQAAQSANIDPEELSLKLKKLKDNESIQ